MSISPNHKTLITPISLKHFFWSQADTHHSAITCCSLCTAYAAITARAQGHFLYSAE